MANLKSALHCMIHYDTAEPGSGFLAQVLQIFSICARNAPMFTRHGPTWLEYIHVVFITSNDWDQIQ